LFACANCLICLAICGYSAKKKLSVDIIAIYLCMVLLKKIIYAWCEAFFFLVGFDRVCSLTTLVKKVDCVVLLYAVMDLLD
jgi:hypothetical protein